MTKEEYLRIYREDKLAEICEQLEKERDYYKDEMNSYKRDAQLFQKNADDFSSYWKSMDRLFDKLLTIPAKDFIKLYYLMQGTLNNHERYDKACISDMDNLSAITVTHN